METPKYKQIIDCFKEKILSGELKPGDKLPGFVNLARQFGVSTITSNRALSELEKMGLVERREREGTFVAQRTGKLNKLLVVSSVPIVDQHPQIMGYWEGIIEIGNKNNLSVELVSPQSPDFTAGKILEGVENQAIMFLMRPESFAIELVRKYHKPYVIIGVKLEGNYCILEDRFNASKELVNVLIEDGYRKIGFVGNLSASNHRLARDGYLEGIAPLNIGHRFIRDANEGNVRKIVAELIEDGVDAIVVMGGYLPIVAFPEILSGDEKELKVALGVFTENPAILRLKGSAYVAYYSQSETSALAFEILSEIFSGNIPDREVFHPPFEIYRPE